VALAEATARIHELEQGLAVLARARPRDARLGKLKQKGVNGPALDKAVKEGGRDSLRNQIDQLLLVQKGKDLNINVDAEVTKQLGKMQVSGQTLINKGALSYPEVAQPTVRRHPSRLRHLELLHPNLLVRSAFYFSLAAIPFLRLYVPGTGERVGVQRVA